jgi:hypothetical protein
MGRNNKTKGLQRWGEQQKQQRKASDKQREQRQVNLQKVKKLREDSKMPLQNAREEDEARANRHMEELLAQEDGVPEPETTSTATPERSIWYLPWAYNSKMGAHAQMDACVQQLVQFKHPVASMEDLERICATRVDNDAHQQSQAVHRKQLQNELDHWDELLDCAPVDNSPPESFWGYFDHPEVRSYMKRAMQADMEDDENQAKQRQEAGNDFVSWVRVRQCLRVHLCQRAVQPKWCDHIMGHVSEVV